MQDFKDNMKRLGTKNLQESETLNEQSTNSLLTENKMLLTEIRDLIREIIKMKQQG